MRILVKFDPQTMPVFIAVITAESAIMSVVVPSYPAATPGAHAGDDGKSPSTDQVLSASNATVHSLASRAYARTEHGIDLDLFGGRRLRALKSQVASMSRGFSMVVQTAKNSILQSLPSIPSNDSASFISSIRGSNASIFARCGPVPAKGEHAPQLSALIQAAFVVYQCSGELKTLFPIRGSGELGGPVIRIFQRDTSARAP